MPLQIIHTLELLNCQKNCQKNCKKNSKLSKIVKKLSKLSKIVKTLKNCISAQAAPREVIAGAGGQGPLHLRCHLQRHIHQVYICAHFIY